MLNDLNELYQEVILDHNNSPHNFGRILNPTHVGSGHNILCGDKIDVFIDVRFDKILDIKFEGSGCAISKSSASMMTDTLKGKTLLKAEELFNEFHNLLTKNDDHNNNLKLLGKLIVFNGVKKFPIRIKCATLSWHTMKSALSK